MKNYDNEVRDNSNFTDSSRDGRRVQLYVPDKLLADFIIKINNESIAFRRFFNIVIEGYLSDDERIMSFVKQTLATRPKYHSRLLELEKEKVVEVETQFGLNSKEIEDMYDILEEEFNIEDINE